MSPDDHKMYYTRRAEEERKRASETALPEARAIHATLAENYARMAERGVQTTTGISVSCRCARSDLAGG